MPPDSFIVTHTRMPMVPAELHREIVSLQLKRKPACKSVPMPLKTTHHVRMCSLESTPKMGTVGVSMRETNVRENKKRVFINSAL